MLGGHASADGRARVERPPAPIGLVCLVHAQSEVGTVQPVVAAAELAANLQVPLPFDGDLRDDEDPLDPEDLLPDEDLLTGEDLLSDEDEDSAGS